MTDLPPDWPVCPECAKPERVRNNGRMWKHLYGDRKWQQDCEGSGDLAITAEKAAEACPAPSCRKPGTHRGLHDIPAGKPRQAVS